MTTEAVVKAAPAKSDPRWKLLDATMRRNGHESHALIEALHTAQEAFGYIDEEAMRYVAKALKVPLSKVFGVATFYHFFSLKPQGEHTCVVCMGTACYIKGAPKLIDAVSEKYNVTEGETSPDGKLSLVSARCFGACGLAPAVVVDGEVMGKLAAADLLEKLERKVAS